SPLHGIAITFLAAFNDLDGSAHVALRTPDCQHFFAPASLNLVSPKSNEEFKAHLTNLHAVMEHFPVAAKEIHVHDSGPNSQVIIWATGTPAFRAEAIDDEEDWNVTNEYMFILDFDESQKIKRIVEFLDAKTTGRL
ncbi:hypothetical protein BDV95DRAFT_472922, partial [Massariosphaeria phaeospora]